MLWVMGSLRLFLEWMMVPLFAIALQLPQGALCYWATSSGLALAQNHALKQPAVRRLVGLPIGGSQQAETQQQPAPAPPSREAAAGAAAAVAAGAAGPLPADVDPQLRQFLLTTSDQGALFDKAAALRAEGRAGASSAVLNRLLQLYPGQPNALYALGQVRVAGRQAQAGRQAVGKRPKVSGLVCISNLGISVQAAHDAVPLCLCVFMWRAGACSAQGLGAVRAILPAGSTAQAGKAPMQYLSS
jgi:hypothetical protein